MHVPFGTIQIAFWILHPSIILFFQTVLLSQLHTFKWSALHFFFCSFFHSDLHVLLPFLSFLYYFFLPSIFGYSFSRWALITPNESSFVICCDILYTYFYTLFTLFLLMHFSCLLTKVRIFLVSDQAFALREPVCNTQIQILQCN